MKSNQKGFSVVEGLLIFVIVAIIGFVGWYVWHSKNNTNKSLSNANNASNTTSTVKPANNTTTKTVQTADPYADWKTYSNSTYGISYKYPTSWTTSGDVTSDATTKSSSATKQEFGTGLKLTTDTKYNNTVVVEVLDENLSTATAWYDSYYAQSSLNNVSKKAETLKGKSAVSYDVTNSGNDSKLYLFSVGNKTYSFGSVNEELNVQNSANYWTTFQKVFDSLTLK